MAVVVYLLLSLLVAAQGYIITFPEPDAPPPRTCCFGDAEYEDGEVVVSLPRACLHLVCVDGKVERRYLGGKEGMKNCCEFDGQLYPDGAQLPSVCLPLVCNNTCWEPTGDIDDCCSHCCFHDDPHIYTFDGHLYDHHGTCNYSAAQTDATHDPPAGVFTDFAPCYAGASCLAHTTFRNDEHTIITLVNSAVFDIHVNGEPFHVKAGKVQNVKSSAGCHPVLAWRTPFVQQGSSLNPYCVLLLGSSRLVIQHCPHRLDIWAHPSHMDQLDGLCGHYNQYSLDDFTARTGFVHTLHQWPLAFPLSWLTDIQTTRTCIPICPTCLDDNTTSPCNATEGELSRFLQMCGTYLRPMIGDKAELESFIDTCAFDLCVIAGHGEGARALHSWLRNLQHNLEISVRILDKRL